MEMEKQRATKKQQVFMQHVTSMEYYAKENEAPIQVFRDLNFEAKQGKIWAVVADRAFEARLLLEIMANARAYKDGTCVLGERGMMRKKRVILPHVYYIGSTNMLFDNMKVLEYLMFITAHSEVPVVDRQQQIFERLQDWGLGYLSLSLIRDMTPAERSLLSVAAALFTESELIVWNLARLQYDERGLLALKGLCQAIIVQQRTLVFSSFDETLIQTCATHIACLYDGAFLYTGEVEPFLKTWDHLCVVIQDERWETMQAILQTRFPKLVYEYQDAQLQIWDHTLNSETYTQVAKTLSEHQLYPEHIHRHPRCIANAWKEIRKYHDLQL